MKLHQGPGFIDSMVNSIEVVVNSKMNFVKVFQNHLLFQKPLMLHANWYRKIVMWPIETTLGISGTNIHSISHEHLTIKKICFRVGFHTICQSLKKRLVSIGFKEMLQKYDHGASYLISWQVLNCGFTRMSPKVNSSRMYGCFKMSQVQQKLLAHETLPSKCSPAFFQKN